MLCTWSTAFFRSAAKMGFGLPAGAVDLPFFFFLPGLVAGPGAPATQGDGMESYGRRHVRGHLRLNSYCRSKLIKAASSAGLRLRTWTSKIHHGVYVCYYYAVFRCTRRIFEAQ
jgi:hypothetical protein